MYKMRFLINKVRVIFALLTPVTDFFQKYHNRNNCIFQKGSIIKDCVLEGKNKVFYNTRLNNCYLGKGSYIQHDSVFNLTKIGRYCSIADNVITGFGAHPTNTFVSTYPSFYRNTFNSLGHSFHYSDIPLFDKIYRYADEEDKKLVVIGNDCWIGSHVLIMDGVRIGDGAVVAAGSVVTKDVEPYVIVGGIPAKTIRKRFKQEYIDFLLDFKWWNKDDKWIDNNYVLFDNIENFINKLKEKKENEHLIVSN